MFFCIRSYNWPLLCIAASASRTEQGITWWEMLKKVLAWYHSTSVVTEYFLSTMFYVMPGRI